VDKQKTARQLDFAGLDYTLVVPLEDVEQYAKFKNVLGCPDIGIRATRQFIMDTARKGKVIQLDDDLTFYRRSDDGKKFYPIEGESVYEMFEFIGEMLDGYAHLGLVDKFMSQSQPRIMRHNGRFTHLLAYNMDLFHVKPQYRVEVCEEHDYNLQLLLAGHPSCILTEFSKVETPRAPGGCNTWRHDQLEVDACKEMERLFPGIVQADGIKIRVNWKKAGQNAGNG
jgi:hypothetical protein